MTFTVTIECDNDAFVHDDFENSRNEEVGRILRALASSVQMDPSPHTLRDCNGNVVGSAACREE